MLEYAINKNNFRGYQEATFIGGLSVYSDKSRDDYIKEGYKIISEGEYEALLDDHLNELCSGQWREITEENYEEMLNVLPPLKWGNGGFFVSELYSHDVTGYYQQLNDKYYYKRQRISTSKDEIIKDLRQAIVDNEIISL